MWGRIPAVRREQWGGRVAGGRVQDRDGEALAAVHPDRGGRELRYFREVADEEPIAFRETVLHADDDLWVVDNPHFLPVVPAGRHVADKPLARLQSMSGNDALVPLPRIARGTHALVPFVAGREKVGRTPVGDRTANAGQ